MIFGYVVLAYSQTDNYLDSIPKSYWKLEDAKKLAKGFNASDKWEMETLKMEIENSKKYHTPDLPLYSSPFPTPTYESPGNGNGPIEIKIAGKNLIGQYAIIGRFEYSNYLFRNTDDQYVCYFAILTIADGKKTENPVLASSRNHPHYFSQGSLNTTTKSRVDWIAMQLADKTAYAIVNGRIFDLRVGRVILAAPQKDGSIRFYQMESPAMNSTERKSYFNNLKNDTLVNSFFSNPGNL
jgi:hypothetical protein